LGAYHYETDGFRDNNDRDQDIANAFAQVSLTPDTSLQGEYRYTDTENGDTELRFDPEDFRPGLRRNTDSRFYRLGLHQRLSPGADLIGSFIFEDTDVAVTNTDRTSDFDIVTEDDAEGDTYLTELQYLFSFKPLSLITGAGYLKADNDGSTVTTVVYPPPADPFIVSDDTNETDIQHTNLYCYSLISYPRHFIWTLGASGDFFSENVDSEEIRDRNQLNPKLGLTWNPLPGTQLRAAAFRTLRRTLTLTKQTIEPTQVAGFNQFFDDDPGTDAWRYGVALDQTFNSRLYGGLEYARRELEVLARVPTATPTRFERSDWNEQSARTYLYFAPHERVALTGEYFYERHQREEQFNNGVAFVETHRFPLGLNLFHPSGWRLKTLATYVSQHGRFNRLGALNLPAESGEDCFWIVDASLSYRLPGRFGIISLMAKNLFDTAFDYHDTDLVNPALQPERLILLKATLSL
jgi:hypothetical protein